MKHYILLIACTFLVSQGLYAQCTSNVEVDDLDEFSENSCEVTSELTNNIYDKKNSSEETEISKKIETALSQLEKEIDRDLNLLNEKILSKEVSIQKQNESILAVENKNVVLEDYIEKNKNDPSKKAYISSKKQSIESNNLSIANKKERIVKFEKDIQDLKSDISNKKRVSENLKTKGTQIALNSMKKECKGAFKKAEFKEKPVRLLGKVTSVSARGSNINYYEWKDTETKNIKKVPVKRVLGMFNDRDEAQSYVDGLYETDPNIVECKIDHALEKEMVTVPNKVTLKNQNLTAINNAGDSFPDNGMSLNTQSSTAKKAWDSNVEGWSKELESYTDDQGRSVERNLREVKVYSCASMYTNCTPGRSRGPNENSCGTLDYLRTAFTDDRFDIDTFEQRVTEPSESTKKSNYYKEFQKLSAEDQKNVKRLFSRTSPFVKTLKDLKKEDSKFEKDIWRGISSTSSSKDSDGLISPNRAEQMTFLALSTLRGFSMADEFMKSAGKDSKDVKITIIPTGHPDDPFNNSKLDPKLSGTCGPLPKKGSTMYGLCSQKGMCTEFSSECSKVKEYYGREDIKKELANTYDKSYLTKKYGTLDKVPANEKYSFHRYYQIEPVVDEEISDSIQKELDVDRYFVSCKGIKFQCTDTSPDISFKGSFTVGNHGRMPKSSSGSSSTTACPAW